MPIFDSSGWDTSGGITQGGFNPFSDMVVRTRSESSAADKLFEILKSIGLQVRRQINNQTHDDRIEIVIGSH